MSHRHSSHEKEFHVRPQDCQEIEVEDELRSDCSSDELCLEGH